MEFSPSRLIEIRESLGINKAEAAKMLNLSAMGYGRYDNGDRVHTFQTVSFIAQAFGTTTEYLYGLTDSPASKSITITQSEDPELFELVNAIKNEDALSKRLLNYYNKLKKG